MAEEPTKSTGDAPVIYSNNVNVRMTLYDFALAFGIGADEDVATQAVVHMSPQHALSLSILLDRFVESYQRHVGPIVLPPEVVQRLKGGPGEDEDNDESAN